MKQNNQNKLHMLKEKCIAAQDWVMDHTKIVMPLVLVVCVLITVLIAVRANRQEKLEEEAQIAAAVAGQESSSGAVGSLSSPEFELEENAYPEINSIVRCYYDAQAEGDVETVSSLNSYLDDIAKIRVEEMSKYIEAYPVVDVYTKPGLAENTYVAYVYSEVQFQDVEQRFPGMQTFYIGLDNNGDYFINDGTYDSAVWDYIKTVTLQDDVVDLNNRVTVEYNELLENNEELSEYIAYLREKVSEEVGEILAEAEQPVSGEEIQTADAGESDEADGTQVPMTEPIASVVRTVRATDVVNIRTSDSETADKIDKAQIGQEFTLLEQRGNGWSKVKYKDGEAFIKSDYLEVVQEVVVANNTSAESNTENAGNATNTTSQSGSQEVIGTVKVIENVKVRKGASTSSASLGTAYVGETLDVIMKQADGWTKIKYNGEIAYVKSDYVE